MNIDRPPQLPVPAQPPHGPDRVVLLVSLVSNLALTVGIASGNWQLAATLAGELLLIVLGHTKGRGSGE